jgi:hypothetical protein
MAKLLGFAVVLSASILLLSPPLPSQNNKPDPRLSKTSVAFSEARTKKIKLELRRIKGHDWAGEYFFGDGLGVNISLALAPESGFVYSWHDCLGLYDLNYGDVEFTDGKIKLHFKYPNERVGSLGMPSELFPVRWGNRHYLIAADGMVDFANAINAGMEPSSLFGGRSGSFLLRQGDEKQPVAGQPDIPAAYRAYLLLNPINANVSSVQGTRVKESSRFTDVTIDAGSAEGLKQGMELYVHSPSSTFASAVLKNVAEHTATAVVEQILVSTRDPVPAAGWELSTKLSSDREAEGPHC